jgi:hypothetical protein
LKLPKLTVVLLDDSESIEPLENPASSSASRTQEVTSPSRGGIRAFIGGLIFGSPNKPASREAANIEGVIDTGIAAHNVTESTEPQETQSIPSGPTKRKPPVRDQYEVPSDPTPEYEAADATESPPKRLKASIKAKQPLVAAKRSNGGKLEVQSRQLRNGVESGGQHSYATPPASTKTNFNDSPAKTKTDDPIIPKRKRGRPPKKDVQAPALNNHAPDLAPPSIERNSVVMGSISNAQARPGEHAGADTAGSTGADISGILTNLSPVKTTAEADVLRTSAHKQQGKPIFSGVPDLSEDEEDDMLNDNKAQDHGEAMGQNDNQDADENDVVEQEQPAATELEDLFGTILEELNFKAARVGTKYDIKEKKWSVPFTHTSIYSVKGKRLDRRLQRLKTGYNGMKNAKASTDNDALENSQSKIKAVVDELRKEVEDTLSSRLGDPQRGLEYFEEQPTRTLLIDLYFKIIPDFVKVIKLGVNAHDAQGSIETPALEEISELLRFLYQLASGAVRQPSEAQPKSQRYNTSQPTRELVPVVRQLQQKLLEELKSRNRKLAQAEYLRKQPERDRKRREKEEEEEAENRRRRKEIYRLQREALQRKLSEPLFGRLLAADIEREAAKAAERNQQLMPFRHRTSSQQTQERHTSVYQEVEDDPFRDDDEGYQRVHVFDTEKNKRKIDGRNDEDRLKKWSEDERTYFIEGLRLYQGKIFAKPLCNRLLL